MENEEKEVPEDIVEDTIEETDRKPKSRWFLTTCRFCGDIYRFRSDQPQPPTCGSPLCIAKFEGSREKIKLAVLIRS